MKVTIVLFILSLMPVFSKAQELFPYAEPASTLPAGVPGVRFMYENYREIPSQRVKYWTGVRFMYGVTSKLTAMVTVSASNHHTRVFPADLRSYFINHHQKTFKPNPYVFEGIHLYAKYRLLSIDEKQKHLRIAAYVEGAKSFVAHDQAEPVLGDNSGYGGGLIATRLHKKFAASFTAGFVNAITYKDDQQQITFKASDAWHYNLSLGYRVWPVKYSGYGNVNVNIYAELINKQYGLAQMTKKGKPFYFDDYKYYDINIYNGLQANSYSELRPSIQFIFNSNERVDIGCALPVRSKSYLYFYPMIFIHFQKYFF